jgi:hypothetical protein
MSSLPASPNPQKPRVLDLGRKARGVLGARVPAAHRRADRPAPPTAGPPTATALPAGELVIPKPPAAAPPPALPARIPFSEWKGPRPRAVSLAFALIVVGGIISLSGGIATSRSPVTELPPNIAELEMLGVDAGEYAAAMQVVALAAALVVFGIYLLLAVLIREGRNWARIGGSVLAAAALTKAVAAGSGVQVAALLVAAAGLGMLYRSDCRRYFRPRRSQYLSEPSGFVTPPPP